MGSDYQPKESLPELHPQVVLLRAECESLRKELAQKIADRDVLLDTVIPNAQADYLVKIGQTLYEIFCVEVKTRRMKREIEMIQAAVNRGEKPSHDDIAAALDREFVEWEEQARQRFGEIEEARHRLAHLCTAEESRKIQSLFRKLAKRLHPDVNPDLAPEMSALWDRVLSAYRNGDIEELESLELLLDTMPETYRPPSALDELKTMIQKIRDKVRQTVAAIEKLKNEFPFNMQDKLRDPEWVKSEQESNGRKLAQAKMHLEHVEAVLDAMKEEG